MTEFKVQQAYVGLNTDNILSQLKEGSLTFAKNAAVEGFDGNQVTYQNEQSNVLCVNIPDGYFTIGEVNIIEQDKTILFLANPATGDSEIGARINSKCTYNRIINSKCLNFNRDYPIHTIEVKTSNCNTQLFWTDGYNSRRWMDLDDLPFVEHPDPNKEGSFIKDTTAVDCNKILVQPNFSIPELTAVSVDVGGDLVMGDYQFAIQYANSLKEGYTSWYAITNPIGIWEMQFTQDFNHNTTKAINLNITNIDISGLYEYFNIAVIKTINNITSVELVGNYAITGKDYHTTYTGEVNTDIRLSIADIFERFPYYDVAQDVTSSDNTLLWANLSVIQRVNYQKFWASLNLQWQTWKVPYNKFEGYSNPINTGNLRGYFRDEIYALEGCFILKNGKITEKFHIPGPKITSYEREPIINEDANNVTGNPCEIPLEKQRWEVYNTGQVSGYTNEYLNNNDDCYKGTYQYGTFGGWESIETYPNNKYIWGDLAGTPILHFKMPDCGISPHYSVEGNQAFIYPLGIKIDAQEFYALLKNTGIAQEDLDQIQGFKITRANRVNNKSIIAKGMFFNVGSYTFENQKYRFPNYLYNDLRADPYLSATKVLHHSGANVSSRLEAFDEESKSRMTFFSPDTLFYQPFGIDTGYVKMETIENGTSRGHFVEVKDNAKYKFLTFTAIRLAFAAGLAGVVSLDTGGGFLGVAPSVSLDASNIPTTFITVLELIKTLMPFVNYGYQYNSVGEYNASLPVPNAGNKIRSIVDGRYLIAGFQTVDGEIINNSRRESTVYVKTSTGIDFPHEQGGLIDQSKYTLSSAGGCDTPSQYITKDISSYYGSIKRVSIGQYGRMYSYESIDTGFYQRLINDEGEEYTSFPTIFGGDAFINRFAFKKKFPFFLDDTVAKPNQTDIALDKLGNVAYPIYFYSTDQVEGEIDLSNIDQYINILTDFDFGTIAGNIISGGVRPFAAGLGIMLRLFNGYLKVFGINNINLDCPTSTNLTEYGKVYLFAYAIPYFFTESEVNVDYRQAINELDGNYYPNVGTDIPDNWLQEVNVPINRDNSYIYNKTYSKQNKETSFTSLREDFDPNKLCQTEFPNRIIYSQKANLEETKNNWLIYRPISYFDFPKNLGGLTAVDGLEDRRLLVRFKNASQMYNVFATVNTSVQTAYLGNPTFFSQPPLDFATSDTGYFGSQHAFLLKTENGHISVDADRGQVFLFRGNQLTDISANGMSKFFAQNLPFQISKAFPGINIDNHFKDIGLTGVYDAYYSRFIITKKDYLPLVTGITYNGSFFTYQGKRIEVTDPTYFCNLSFTISYSLSTQSWISFHSYVPNYYISHSNYFETGLNQGIWRHDEGTKFNNFYGKIEDYILEYPLVDVPEEVIVGSISDETTVLKYTAPDTFFEVEEGIYFNHAVIYNKMQCTGLLNLVPKPRNNLRAYMTYPKFRADSKDILVTKSDNLFSFNTFWNIVKDPTKPFFSRSCDIPSLDRKFDTNLDYTIRSHAKARIRATENKIRLIYNTSDEYKLISKFIVTETQKSKH